MKIAILTIGDEICIGQITNTNASWIASACTSIGAQVTIHSTIGDTSKELVDELHRLQSLVDCIIITGGLGPTHDDKTKETLKNYFNDSYILHEPTLNLLQERANLRGIELTQRNQDQALVPSSCTVLLNTRGTAPGMLFEQDGISYISLPGVPLEMKGLMNDFVLPNINEKLQSFQGNRAYYRTLLTKGIPESNLADLIGDPHHFLQSNDSLAFLPSYQGVRLRLGTKADEKVQGQFRLEQLSNILYEKVGSYIFGEGDGSLLTETVKLLNHHNCTIGVVESCTGGTLGEALTSLQGSSSYFMGGLLTYSNELKISLAHVSPTTIEKHGAVSEKVAEEMAMGGLKVLNTSYCLSITGIAGPGGGTPEKPVGTVWVGLASKNTVITRKFVFGADREMNRERSVSAAIGMLYDALQAL